MYNYLVNNINNITSISITYKLAVRARVSLEFEVAVIHSLQK